MKKFLKIIGIYFLTMFTMLIITGLLLWLYIKMRDGYISSEEIILVSIYSLAGLIGACTYILYTKKEIIEQK